ncbi:hypothetical protein HOY82DRAFT_478613 [Tuber indicum]|nr:hypothetical protein HOY82DRAFT_478613 [Tuber indicum]
MSQTGSKLSWVVLGCSNKHCSTATHQAIGCVISSFTSTAALFPRPPEDKACSILQTLRQYFSPVPGRFCSTLTKVKAHTYIPEVIPLFSSPELFPLRG